MTRIEKIARIVTEYYELEYYKLFRVSRKATIRRPRQIIHYLARKHTTMSYEAISSFFAQNHATVIHSEKKVQDEFDTNRQMRLEIHEIRMIMAKQGVLSKKYKNALDHCKPKPMEFIRVQAA